MRLTANALGYSVMDVIQVAQRVSGKTIRVKTAPVLVGAADRARCSEIHQTLGPDQVTKKRIGN